MKKPIIGTSFAVVCALEETKRRQEKFSRGRLKHFGIKLSDKEWNQYVFLCKDELGFSNEVYDEEEMEQQAAE